MSQRIRPPYRLSAVATHAILGAAAMLCSWSAGATGPLRYPHGERINLATVRGAKVSAGENCTTPAHWVCRPVHTQEMRFHSNYGPAWWMIELPAVYRLSGHRVGYRSPMKSVGYRLKVSTEPLDAAGWAACKPVFEFRGPVEDLGHDGLSSGWTTGEPSTAPMAGTRRATTGRSGIATDTA